MRKEIVVGYENKDLVGYFWDEVASPKAVVQIVHGMQEHAKRYDDFAKFLNSKGFIVFASDLRGHGETCGNVNDLGHTNGDIFNEIVKDQIIITELLQKQYDLPVYVLGHSFGSFITQRYIQECSLAKKVVICGSAYTKTFIMWMGGLVANLTALFKGSHTRARLIEKLSFGSYAKNFEHGNWLCSDESVFEAYKKDPYCGTPFPVCFYKSMFKNVFNNYKHLKNISKDQQVFLIAGDKDPVGENGKLVEKLYAVYKKHGVDVSLKLYKNDRHEILNGVNKREVYADIVNFFEK